MPGEYGPRGTVQTSMVTGGHSTRGRVPGGMVLGVWSKGGMVTGGCGPRGRVPRGMVIGAWSKGSMVTGGYGPRGVWSKGVWSQKGMVPGVQSQGVHGPGGTVPCWYCGKAPPYPLWTE